MKKLMLSLFIAFGFSACSLSNDDLNVDCGTNADLPFSGFPLLCNYSVKTFPNNPSALIITSQEKMDSYFTKHANTCTVASDPNINFSDNYMIALFAGVKPTNGYAIKITSIVQNNCEIIVNFYEKGPQTGETLTQTPTYPTDFILIPKTAKAILFNRTNESPDNIVIGSFGTTNDFFQINDYNVLKFLGVTTGNYEFEQYKYNAKTVRSEYTTLSKTIPTEITAIKGQTKTYGTPGAQGGVYFELRQGITVTKITIDNNDTADMSSEIKAFRMALKAKINSLK
ncbi:PrcB C-terminal [Flavobacterium sp. CF108]|uniref:protease complex subunit PrcB family protein n=1 Tax=unclassified Flavobacterium TaxID=196869 RepID=UPI0008C55B7A|nr:MULTISPECIES: protease complex subunit PrcB family protein [unclassified Flavobacterium]SEO38419.1 PrcB C-terminal [Flavobacterium sp. fv08]SHH65425.1 PrcB C-terminal [Flavobacterium sp. CF108]